MGTEKLSGRMALATAHCAGTIDMVALPLWVGVIVAWYGFDPQQAGGLVTLFLAGAVASSLFFAARFHRFRAKLPAGVGFAVAAGAFCALSWAQGYAGMAALHALAGFSVGCGLSFTHGTIGRSANPHRLYAIANMGLGVFALLFLAGVPKLIAASGGPVLFWIMAAVMTVAVVAISVAFPAASSSPQDHRVAHAPLRPPVWFAIGGVCCMALAQSMIFSFVERIGVDRGFGAAAVGGVLIAVGFVNLFPAVLAALLQKRWSARTVILCGPLLQGALAVVLTNSDGFVSYAAAAIFFPAMIILTHTFAFGFLAHLDPSGRTLAATPAMVMAGAAIGPVLGGTLVKAVGYESLGIAATVVAVCAVSCFFQARRGTPNPAFDSKSGQIV